MKDGIHPDYGYVVFRDAAAGYSFLTRSTATSEKTIEWENGRTYPVVDVQISSASHPFWTGRSRSYEDQSRVAKFMRKYGKTPSQS
ncbi:type B 50S ribosomal protein L31 [Haloglycomyces albus]|uniref:type B 50S ribosomal protein L31 n=1 Tax=Haloglycomyces albus TaxID=526067 RepID=UPI00046CD76C|nr:type B 50S ribosomal protein L31 [Haloglycomyces albus]